MKIEWLLETFSDQPIVESDSIITLTGDAPSARVQISRWVASGVLLQLRRGYYLLAKRYRKKEPDPLYIANVLCAPSYVSLEYALGYYGLIPESVAAITSITTGRPQVLDTPLCRFDYHHVTPPRFFGYETQGLRSFAPVQIALPEKALLDLVYFTPGRIDEHFFDSIRLQNIESLDLAVLRDTASRMGGPKMRFAVEAFKRFRLSFMEDAR
jgi:predicted transcriptional regulator of viral defense system